MQTPLILFASLSSALSITATSYTNITNDPQGSVRLNGLSFQQNPLVTFGDYQYVAFYATAGSDSNYGKHYVNLGRRRINPSVGSWQYLAFTDYTQTTLDEHNTISLGISGDGFIHLSYDHHDVPLNYRVSKTAIAKTIPQTWTASDFGATRHDLPGASGPWTPLTYPRFERLESGDMIMEFRIGQSGAGDSWLHLYSSTTRTWTTIGKYLQGDDNNAYINGFTHQNGDLHVSWTVRETPDASTNHDFYYTYSTDVGKTWRQTSGATVAKPILPTTPGIKVFDIPQNSQIINQEAQCADSTGRFHALMRDNSSSVATFYHYLRTPQGVFSKKPMTLPGLSIPPYLAYRGKIAAIGNGDNIVAIIPDAPKETVTIWVATAAANYGDWKKLADIPNMAGEPNYDEERLDKFGILSVFARQNGPYLTRKVQVWDFTLKQ